MYAKLVKKSQLDNTAPGQYRTILNPLDVFDTLDGLKFLYQRGKLRKVAYAYGKHRDEDIIVRVNPDIAHIYTHIL